MKRALQVILPLLVLGGAGWIFWWLVSSKPETEQRRRPPAVTRVEAIRLAPARYEVVLETRGVVRPRTETTLLPEVSGRVVEVSPSFREGSFFEEGEVLLRLDPLDYETAVVLAESGLAQARVAVEEEKARSAQALENWSRLGKTGQPGDLALRKPQLAESEARLAAAEAELARARRDLERSEIRAPYAGRVLEQSVDLGQAVAPGTPLARVFAIDYVEVRLPLTNRQLAFIDLPELYRGNLTEGHERPDAAPPEVLLQAEIGRETASWKGRLVRIEGAVDERTRQLFVVAQVDDPYRWQEDGSPPLKIGLFVDSFIQGRVLEDVFVLPRQAVRPGDEVILISEDHRIQRRPVKVLWSDQGHVVVPAEDGGLSAGEILCLTPLAFPADGAPVLPSIDGEAPTPELGGAQRGPGRPPPGDPPGGTPAASAAPPPLPPSGGG